MVTAEQTQTFTTENLALAGYLEYEGQGSTQAYLRDGLTVWDFNRTPELLRLVEKFTSGDARVEPKLFTQMLAPIRREMNVLKFGDGRRRR